MSVNDCALLGVRRGWKPCSYAGLLASAGGKELSAGSEFALLARHWPCRFPLMSLALSTQLRRFNESNTAGMIKSEKACHGE